MRCFSERSSVKGEGLGEGWPQNRGPMSGERILFIFIIVHSVRYPHRFRLFWREISFLNLCFVDNALWGTLWGYPSYLLGLHFGASGSSGGSTSGPLGSIWNFLSSPLALLAPTFAFWMYSGPPKSLQASPRSPFFTDSVLWA